MRLFTACDGTWFAFLETNRSPGGYSLRDMKAISMQVSIGCQPSGRNLVLGLATLAVMTGLGYAFWCLALAVQCWAASSPWAAQIIQ
jgi:hypothetical protein